MQPGGGGVCHNQQLFPSGGAFDEHNETVPAGLKYFFHAPAQALFPYLIQGEF